MAKTTGKYTLKGAGKLAELAGRGVVKTADALVSNPFVQKIATGAGLLAASVAIPPVGGIFLTAAAMKFALDRTIFNKNTQIFDSINFMLDAGTNITRGISSKFISPALGKMDKGIGKMGQKFQNKVDDMDMFR